VTRFLSLLQTLWKKKQPVVAVLRQRNGGFHEAIRRVPRHRVLPSRQFSPATRMGCHFLRAMARTHTANFLIRQCWHADCQQHRRRTKRRLWSEENAMNYLDSRPKLSAVGRQDDADDLHERAMEGKYLVDREDEYHRADQEESDEDSWFNDDPDADGVDELNFE
jgi:hypothetical protein